MAIKRGNLEFDNLGNKPWNLRNFENNLEKPGIWYKSYGKTWNFLEKSWKNLELFFNLNFLTTFL